MTAPARDDVQDLTTAVLARRLAVGSWTVGRSDITVAILDAWLAERFGS